MRRMIRARTSPALVISAIALFVSLGGAGYAAVSISKNGVKAQHIAKGAVGTSEVANRSLKAADLKAAAVAGVQSGVVDAAGTSTSNPVVTVSKNGTGSYKLTFATGTWSNEGRPLALTVTPFGINGGVVNPVVTGGQRNADGSAVFDVTLSSTQPAVTPQDNGFMFVAATSG